MTEEFQKDLTVQQLGSKLVVNLWLMDGIVFEKINTAAVKSSNIKIRGRAKNKKKIVLVGLGPYREHLPLARVMQVRCPPPPAASTGAGRDRGGQ